MHTKNNIRNIRIFVGASNLFTITPYTGLDPENDSYPVPQTFFMGLTAKFLTMSLFIIHNENMEQADNLLLNKWMIKSEFHMTPLKINN